MDYGALPTGGGNREVSLSSLRRGDRRSVVDIALDSASMAFIYVGCFTCEGGECKAVASWSTKSSQLLQLNPHRQQRRRGKWPRTDAEETMEKIKRALMSQGRLVPNKRVVFSDDKGELSAAKDRTHLVAWAAPPIDGVATAWLGWSTTGKSISGVSKVLRACADATEASDALTLSKRAMRRAIDKIIAEQTERADEIDLAERVTIAARQAKSEISAQVDSIIHINDGLGAALVADSTTTLEEASTFKQEAKTSVCIQKKKGIILTITLVLVITVVFAVVGGLIALVIWQQICKDGACNKSKD